MLPLTFLEELARTVREQGSEAPVSTLPDTVQAVLLARLDRLPGPTKRLLQAAAVMGKDGALSLLQAVTDVSEETLQQALTRLQAAELLYTVPAFGAPGYTFTHVLTQEVAYQSLLRQTRQYYHARIAQVLAAQDPETADVPPELLAHHYTEAGCYEQAIPYWQRAGERAAARSAHVETIRHLTQGLELLTTLPPTPERPQQALQLHLTLGASLTVTRGWGAPEVAHTYGRARELCQQLGDPPQLFPVLWGLWSIDLLRAAYQTAQTASEQLLTLAQRVQEAALLVEGHFALGTTLFMRGELAPARVHLEQGLAWYDPPPHRTLAALYSFDPQVGCRAFGAAILWMLGYPEQAVQRSQEAVTWAHELAHPFRPKPNKCATGGNKPS